MSIKILLTRSMVSGDIDYIKQGLDSEIKGEYELIVPEEYSEESLCKYANDVDVFLGPYVTKKMISTAKKLKLIQVPWTGMDTFDFDAVKGSNITVCNTHSNADSVAELGVAITLDLLKKVSYHDRKMRQGNWNRDQQPLDLKSKMLKSQSVCILGFGNIGKRIGRIISAFGSRIIAVDDRATAGDVATEVFKNEGIKEAISKSDVVICTLPLTDMTRGMINDDLFSAMKDGVVFVNMSRAAIVDENSTWNALVSGKLGAFGSDVWWNAPKRGESQSYPSSKHEFWKLDNVLMSPHRAGFIEDCLPHLDGAIENIIALANDRKLMCAVDLCRGF